MAEFGAGDASFRAAGGIRGIEALVDDFYRIMDEAAEAVVIRRMHPRDLEESRDKLARFLCGWLGGPKRFRERYGEIHIPRAHEHLPIGDAERDAWLSCMREAIALQPYSSEFADYLLTQLHVPAKRIRETSRDPL